MALSNAEKQAAFRARRKLELQRLRNSDMFTLTADVLRSAVAEQVRERGRDAAALNRLLLSLNLEPVT